ncbi:hypothetical protein [Paludisphaera soli]|nr:hypothetical protein [Paludisphaera soli]
MVTILVALYLCSVALVLSVLSVSSQSEERLGVMFEVATELPRLANQDAA